MPIRTPLTRAAGRGDTDEVLRLLSASPGPSGAEIRVAFENAVGGNHSAVIVAMLDATPEIALKDPTYLRYILQAARGQCWKVAAELMKRGADPFAGSVKWGNGIEGLRGLDPMPEELFLEYCRSNTGGFFRTTPAGCNSLHLTCLYHSLDAMREALAAGVDVNSLTTEGHTALYYALQTNHDDAAKVRLLLLHGAMVHGPVHRIRDADDGYQSSPLYSAIASGCGEEILEALIESGAAMPGVVVSAHSYTANEYRDRLGGRRYLVFDSDGEPHIVTLGDDRRMVGFEDVQIPASWSEADG